jgi:putative lipoprotein (rSAM/lipoprotein system)
MKSSKILAAVLAVLGFQMQSCEYGCPYTTYKTQGTVVDEKGDKIKGAEVKVKIESRPDSLHLSIDKTHPVISTKTAMSDRKGKYETTHKDLDDIGNVKLNYEVITNKDGYQPDTIRKEVKKTDFKYRDEDTWETIATHEINIVLKKR